MKKKKKKDKQKKEKKREKRKRGLKRVTSRDGPKKKKFLRSVNRNRDEIDAQKKQILNSEGRDLGDMLASWEKDAAQCRNAAGANLKKAVQVATVMDHAPAAYRDFLKVVPFVNRECYQALRAYVREWTLAQRKYDDLGRHMAQCMSAPMDIGQVKGDNGKGKKCRSKEKGKSKKENDAARRKCDRQTIPTMLASVGTVTSGNTRKSSVGSRRTKETPPTATVQAVATVNQIGGSDDSFWIFAVSAPSARILVDGGADEHECPTSFATATPLEPAKGGMLRRLDKHRWTDDDVTWKAQVTQPYRRR